MAEHPARILEASRGFRNMTLSASAQRLLLSTSLLKPRSRCTAAVSVGARKNLATSLPPELSPYSIRASSARICGSRTLLTHLKHSKFVKSALFSRECLRDDSNLTTLSSVSVEPRIRSLSVKVDCINFSGSLTPRDEESDDEDTAEGSSTPRNEGCYDEDPTDYSGVVKFEGEVPVQGESLWEMAAKAKGELKPGLYLVGTPIGNLEDITLRALRVLKSATYILAEDTRHSAKLLRYYGIHTPTMSYHKFNEFARRADLIQRLQRGEVLALISDAGMPSVSDPGSELVMACVEANVQVFPIPGPSAVLTALVASGLPTDEFSFVGFLSKQSNSRQKRLVTAAKESATQIFYVPPHRLCRALDDFIFAFGSSRRCAVAREMTKLHEEFWRGTLGDAKVEFEARQPRGELTLVVEGLSERAGVCIATEDELKSRLQSLITAGKSPSEASKLVVEETAARRNAVYSLALEISQKSKGSHTSSCQEPA